MPETLIVGPPVDVPKVVPKTLSPRVRDALRQHAVSKDEISLIDFFDELDLFVIAPPMESMGYRVENGDAYELWESEYATLALNSIGLTVLRWEGTISSVDTRKAVIEVQGAVYYLVY